MPVKHFLFVASLFLAGCCFGQVRPPVTDTTFTDYDALFSELDQLIDSLLTPRSFTIANVSVTSSYFNYASKTSTNTQTKKQLLYSPTLGYYNKNGLGISAGASIVDDGNGFNPYQYAVTGSYDFLKKRSWITGISFAHYFTKADLPFYTSPLQNEMYGYFMYRKLWVKPSVAISYGWGSREAFEEREEQIQNIQLARRGYTRINTKESVADLNLITSVRHDFYFLDLLSKTDFARITPQISFTSGTQQFGFNQTSSTYGTMRTTGKNVLYRTSNISFDNQLYFQPISLTGYLKTEYAIGKFFFQPQVMFDYYFPASTGNFTSSFLINAGVIF